MQIDHAWTTKLDSELYSSVWDRYRDTLLFTQKGAVLGARNSDGVLLDEFRASSTPTRCVSLSSDGSMVAVGEAGGLVSVRNRSGHVESIHSHMSSVRCVAFHPTRHICLSGSEEAIRIWISDMRSTPRVSIGSPCLCLSWHPIGYSFVYGLANGIVSLVDVNRFDSHIWSVNVSGSVWCCSFLTNTELLIGTWDPPNLVSLESADGSRTSQSPLKFHPTCITPFSDHMFFVGDTQGQITLYCRSTSSNFNVLQTINTHHPSFVTSIMIPASNSIFATLFSGMICKYRIHMGTVESANHDSYCIRDTSCLSRFSVFFKHANSQQPQLIYTCGLITAIGAWENQIAVAVGEKLVNIFRVENQTVKVETEFELPNRFSSKIKHIYPIRDKVLIVPSGESEVALYSYRNDSTTSLSISSPVESLKVISEDCFLLMSISGELWHASLSDRTVKKLMATTCNGIKFMNTSFRNTCISILEHSGDLFVFDRFSQAFTASNILACEWNRSVDGLCVILSSSRALCVWDRFKRSSWTVGKLEAKSFFSFDGNQILYIKDDGTVSSVLIPMEKIIQDNIACGSSDSLYRAYIIAVGCTNDPSVLNTVGETAIKLGEIEIAKICFRKSRNKSACFLASLPKTRICPDGYLDLAQGRIESGVRKLWNMGEESRNECIEILVQFRAWSTLLSVGGTESLRTGLSLCKDRLTAGYGYLAIGDLMSACAAFMSCRRNDLVMKCVTGDNLELVIEYLDKTDDWGRLRELLLRTRDTERIAMAHAKRDRWQELEALSKISTEYGKRFLLLHGRRVVESGEDVSGGLWEMIQSGMASVDEISTKCDEWTEKFALSGNFRRSACVAAIDPIDRRDQAKIYYAYSLVVQELAGRSPFAIHDGDLILNACLYLHNRDECLITKNMKGDIQMDRVRNLLVERLFECGCLFSARIVFNTLTDVSELPSGIVSDLRALSGDDLHCEDDHDYMNKCPTCTFASPLLVSGDVCTSCQRPFDRELCLLDPIPFRNEPKDREVGRQIILDRDTVMIVCSYCKSTFLFHKYQDDSKCMLCECPWYKHIEREYGRKGLYYNVGLSSGYLWNNSQRRKNATTTNKTMCHMG